MTRCCCAIGPVVQISIRAAGKYETMGSRADDDRRGPVTHNQTSNTLSLEPNLFNLVAGALRAKGHDVRWVNGGSVGGYQGILFTRDPGLPGPTFDQRSVTEYLPVNGVYRGGSDHRKDGEAVAGEASGRVRV
jgi:hypothetical protein